jgi:putative hydrolase of the HAD superfamily
MIDAVIFDLDETLTDRSASMARYAALFHRDFIDYLRGVSVAEIESMFLALDERGYRPRKQVYAGIVARFPWDSTPEISVVRDHWRASFPASAVGRTGLHETLGALTDWGLRLGIITNGSVMTQSAKIERLRIAKYFSSLVISEAVACEKPDLRIFRRALDEIGSDPEVTWFVGDHPVNDILGAAAAGLVPVWLEGIHPWPAGHPEPVRRIRTLQELLGLVSRESAGAT